MNWIVKEGTVDLIGNGFYDIPGGKGLYVDLDGANLDAGILESIRRHVRDLLPGRTAVVSRTRLPAGLTSEWNVAGPLFDLSRRAGDGLVRRGLHAAAHRSGLDLDRRAVRRFLRGHRVRAALGEFLDFSLEWLDLLQQEGIPLFAHAHGFDVSGLLLEPEWRTAYQKYNQTGGIITMSAYSRDRLLAGGLLPEKVWVAPYGVDVPEVPPARLASGEVRCLAVGRFEPEKAPILLLDSFRRAAARSPALRLNYIGGGRLLPAAREFVLAFGLGDRVHLTGPQPHDAVLAALRRADLFLQHSVTDPDTGNQEGLPVAILEAMAQALPVVATREAGIPEEVVDGVTGWLVEPGDHLRHVRAHRRPGRRPRRPSPAGSGRLGTRARPVFLAAGARRPSRNSGTRVKRLSPLVITVILIGAGLAAYSLTEASDRDETMHLLAAQLVSAGRLPYLDFFHQHPPLYLYGVAAWMKLFGQSWRSAHLFSVLLTTACAWLIGRMVFERLRGTGGETLGALAAALSFGLHALVVREATVGLPYPLCLFLIVAAFQCAVTGRVFLSGLTAGAAAASSLLTAPFGPVLLLWQLLQEPGGRRVSLTARFLTGFACPFLPVAWLALRGPRQVWFNLFEYHLTHRRNFMEDPTMVVNWKILFWLPASSQGLLLLAGAAAALLLAWRGANSRRRELVLAAVLAAVQIGFAACTRPAFSYYLIFAVPFLCLLAGEGLGRLYATLHLPFRPVLLLAPLLALYTFGPVRFAWQHRRDFRFRWPPIEAVARQVDLVTPPGAPVYAYEWIYFAARRLPPPGLNNFFARLIRVPDAQAESLHLVPASRLRAWLLEGRYYTAVLAGTRPGYRDSPVHSPVCPRMD